MAKKSKASSAETSESKPADGAKAEAAKTRTKKSARAPGAENLLKANAIGKLQERFCHPWNPNSEMFGVQLGKRLGLKRVGVSILRLPAGKESFAPHAHHREEEWLYVLMGEGKALIGDEEVSVGAGDFLAFPAPQVLHHLTNVGADDFVYLVGGENAKMDIVDFPTLGKRTVRAGSEITVYPMEAGAVLSLAKPKKPKKAKA